MSKPMTTEMFIERAKIVHNTEYDYSKTEYINMQHKVVIICPAHGEFLQLPQPHLKGQGCPVCGKEKQKKTMLEKYGVDNPMKSKSFVDKARRTCVDKYGSEWAMSNASVKKKVEQTNLDKYGTKVPLQNKQIYAKTQGTLMSKYGKSYLGQIDAFRDKARATCEEKYGTKEPLAAKIVRDKIVKTNFERYGGVAPITSPDIREKIRRTCLERYGVFYPLQSLEIRNKIRETCLERYGVPSLLSLDSVREKGHIKTRELFLQEYGVEYPAQAVEIREKIRRTCLERYGVENPMLSNDIKQKVFDTKLTHGTFSTSEPEELLHMLLCDYFGKENVKRQYNSDVRYAFNCDFYIVSRDMFIELNASWTHGHHWFDPIYDLPMLELWKLKGSKYYNNAIDVWSNRDVLKRQTANDNKLNYVTFWDSDLNDVKLWFDLNCPDGHDYDNMYSWIDIRLM